MLTFYMFAYCGYITYIFVYIYKIDAFTSVALL